MKLLNGKKKIEAVISPYCGDLPKGGEICAMEGGGLADSYGQANKNNKIE